MSSNNNNIQSTEQVASDMLSKITEAAGFTFADPRLVKKHVKQCRAWRFECVEREDDGLDFQIYFTEKFVDLILDKKIAKLISKIELALSQPKFTGEFTIEVVPEVKAVIITSPGFWKNFSVSADEFAKEIEQACESVL